MDKNIKNHFWSEPSVEVWICPSCCAPRLEAGLCLQCEMDRSKRWEVPERHTIALGGIFSILIVLLAGAVWMMLNAAWEFWKIFH